MKTGLDEAHRGFFDSSVDCFLEVGRVADKNVVSASVSIRHSEDC